MKHVVLLLLGGCMLPVSTGAPLPATTVGKGNIGFAISGEAPTLDLIADNGDENQTGSPSAISYGAAPAAATTLTVSYGLGEHTDIEVAGEGALFYFILPFPTGGSIGLRHHIDAGSSFDLGIAAKLGRVSSTAKITTSNGSGGTMESESGASATYTALSATLQTKRGFVRPLVALNLIPARINRDPSDEPAFTFNGMASSLTAGLMFVARNVTFGPYLTATNFYSDRFDNSGWFVSGGLLLALRPDRNREPDVQPAPPMNAPPYPPPAYPPPAPAPYPPGPAPAPTPTTTPM